MKNYRYILLDWDGNLAKTLDLWLEAIRQVLAEEGYHPSDEEIAGSFGQVEAFFAEIGIKNVPEVWGRADQLGRRRLPDVELYPDALKVLRYFKDTDKKTALITSSNRTHVEGLLASHNLRELFDTFIAREDIARPKPDPSALQLALTRLGGNPSEALMIGDSDKDLGAAANAGIDSILFYPPEHKKFYNLDKLKQLHPTYIVDDFRKIMQIVK